MQSRRKIIIIRLAVVGTFGSRQRIKFKVPQELAIIDGYQITTAGDGALVNNVALGKLSLSFNNRASNPIYEDVVSDKVQFKTGKYEYKKLLEPVKKKTLIEGYFINVNPLPVAYTLNIYLKGKELIQE